MKTSMFLVGLLMIGSTAFAESAGPTSWHTEGFVENATPEHRDRSAAAMAMRRDAAAAPAAVVTNWYRCGAIREAQIHLSENFVKPNAKANCNTDDDCALGSLGGFCPVAAHRQQIEGYNLYTGSPAYKHVSGEWTKNSCVGPQGMCLPVTKVTCAKAIPTGPGVCKGEFSQTPTNPPVFMAPNQPLAAK